MLQPAKGLKGQNKEGKGNGDGHSKYSGVNIAKDIIPKEKITEVEIVSPKDKGPKKKKPKVAKKSVKECPGAWYGGIGVEMGFNGKQEIITKIFPGYPADLAGLQIGEIIISIQEEDIIGPPGSLLHMKTNRGDYIIIRGKVCY